MGYKKRSIRYKKMVLEYAGWSVRSQALESTCSCNIRRSCVLRGLTFALVSCGLDE
jgi:carbohydrate-binding DOMON domain-containing protein